MASAAPVQKATIEANIMGIDGRPPKNAQLRIEPVGNAAKAVMVKPDAKGHVTVSDLDAGSYKLTAILDGKLQSSQVVKAGGKKAAAANFDFRKTQTAVTSGKSKKKMIWVPAQVGSRFGGYWKEAGTADQLTNENGVVNADGQGMDNVQRQTRASTRNTSGTR